MMLDRVPYLRGAEHPLVKCALTRGGQYSERG